MRLGMRENTSGVSKVIDYDTVNIWSIGNLYDNAKAIFGKDDCRAWKNILASMKKVDDEDYNCECIALYDSKSELAPRFFDEANKIGAVADEFGEVTAARPDVVYLWCDSSRKCRRLLDRALLNGFLDFKDFDGAMLVYKNIPETSGEHIKAVLLNLEEIEDNRTI